jgi:hypothetical protein
MSIVNAIKNAFDKKKIKNDAEWEYPMYWAIDLHDVIIKSTYNSKDEKEREINPYAIDVLRALSENKNHKLILFTSSQDDYIENILKWLENKDIFFDYVNENPEVKSKGTLDVERKFYFDVLLEDKAGFDIDRDWTRVCILLLKYGVINLKI